MPASTSPSLKDKSGLFQWPSHSKSKSQSWFLSLTQMLRQMQAGLQMALSMMLVQLSCRTTALSGSPGCQLVSETHTSLQYILDVLMQPHRNSAPLKFG